MMMTTKTSILCYTAQKTKRLGVCVEKQDNIEAFNAAFGPGLRVFRATIARVLGITDNFGVLFTGGSAECPRLRSILKADLDHPARVAESYGASVAEDAKISYSFLAEKDLYHW